MSAGKLNVGDRAKLIVTWSPETPGTTVLAEIRCIVTEPDNTTTTFTSVSAPDAVVANGIIPDSYRLDFLISQALIHQVRWESSPTVDAAEQSSFSAVPKNTS